MKSDVTRLVRRTAAALALAAVAATATQAQAFELTIEVSHAKPGMGTVNAAVYTDAADWMKDGRTVAASMAQAADKTVLVFRGLTAGKYGVALYQDENRNGKLDTNIVGIPVERYGFSRDAKGRMGPPSFDDAAVDLQADTTIAVTLF